MKKVITIAALALLAFSGNSLFAQSGEQKIGVKAGLNLANIHGDDAEDNAMKIGFHVGGFATIPFGNLAFQPELLISTRGYKYDSDDVDASTNLMYVDIPLLLKFYASDNFNVHLGPQVGFNLSAKSKFEDESEDIEHISTMDLGAALGVEYDTDMGLVVGARYFYGFTSIGEEYDAEFTNPLTGETMTQTVEAPDIKNNMIQVYVGIGF